MEGNFKVDYELTAQDYIDFNLFHVKNSAKLKRLLFIQRFVLPLIYFVLPFVLARSTNISLWLWMIAAVAVYILWIYMYPARMEKNLSRKLNKALSEERNSKLLGKHSFSLSGDGISDIGTGGESKVKWSSIKNFNESRDHFFVFISDSKAFIIPKRAFKSEDDKNSFSSMLKDKIPA